MAEKEYCSICDRNFKDESGLAAHISAKHSGSSIIGKTESKSFGSSKWLVLLIVGFLAIAGFIVFSGKTSTGTGNAVSDTGEVQKINIGFKNYNYYPQTITVKQGIPVEITLDSSVGGCYRSFNIQSLGVSKFSSSSSDKIVFTPTKAGTFEFACSMRMGTGTIVVE